MVSRRDANKQATREALIRAAVDLSRERGIEEVTVDMVAERVGVSRRTFFNYFPSFDQCLSATFSEALARATRVFDERPGDEPLLTSAWHAFADVFNPHTARDVVWVMRASIESGRLNVHHEIWRQANSSVADSLRARVPEADDLWIRSLAAAIIGIAESVFFTWMSADPESTDIEATYADFKATMAQSLGYLSRGFAIPESSPVLT